MKRWTLVSAAIVTTLVFCASATQRAEAHPGVPMAEGGSAGLPSIFHATDALSQAYRPTSAVPCVDPPTPANDGMAGPFPCRNVNLSAYIPLEVLAGGNTSDIWGWTDPLCTRDYAIMGMSQFTAVVDVTIPEAPVIRAHLRFEGITPGTLWREVKVYSHDPSTPANKADDTHHAYIVQDLLGSGVQIFDLRNLRLPSTPVDPNGCASPVGSPILNLVADASYRQQGTSQTVSNVHTITINTATGFAYLNGSNTCGGGAPHMIDLKPNGAFGPENPRYVGCAGADGYTHDAQCVIYNGPDTDHTGKEICVLYNEDTLTVVDVTDKSNPVQLERETYETAAYTHQGWFTEGQRYIISDDELDEGQTLLNMTPTKSYLWDATDLNNLVKVNTFFHPDTRTDDPADRLICIDHNQYVRGNLVYQSNYACGLRIYDVRNVGSGTLTEVAHFDTNPPAGPAGDLSFNIGGDLTGDWSNYPYFPSSGKVVVSSINKGLFVLEPTLSPTAVKLASFRAQQTGKRVKLTWRTASESDILGFNVFRYSQGQRVEVTKSIVLAKASAGARYSFVDRTARPGAHTYKLQVVSKDGRRQFKATASLRVRR